MKLLQKISIKINTIGKNNVIDRITCVALIIQKIFGYHILDPNWSFRKSVHCYLFSFFLFTYVALGTVKTIRKSSDLKITAEAFYVLIMIAIYPIKMTLFLKNHKTFQELYLATKTNVLDAINQQEKSAKILSKARKIVTTIFVMVTIPVANHQLIALINYAKGHPEPLSRATDILMPLRFPYYEISWVLHSIFLFEVGSTTAVLDMWFVILIFLLCAASESLEKILDVEKRVDESDLSYAKRLNERLRMFYVEHVKQTKLIRLMNDMYKWLAFVPLCNAAMCSCILLFLLSKDLNLKFTPHFLPMFLEIFAYNYFGEKVRTTGANINQAILNFDWTSLQKCDTKNYYIIVSYIMKRNFCVTTGTGSDLSLVTMTSVLQVTYKAFTMLKSVTD